jgi:hypothetical protein
MLSRPGLQLLVGAIAFAVVYLICERIPYNNGLGFDGTTYAAIARAGPLESVRSRVVDSYYVQRMLPSILVHEALRICHVRVTDANIIRGFVVLNIVLMAINLWLWQRIAAELELSPRGRLLGILALFINLFVVKMTGYYPVLTDMAAYTISLAMLYGYLRNSAMILALATLLGCFTWPPSLYLGGVLLLFPRRFGCGTRVDRRPWNVGIALALAAGVVAVLFYVLTGPDGRPTNYAIDWRLVYVSIAVAGAYVFAAVAVFLRHSPALDVRQLLREVVSFRTLAVGVFLAAVRLSQYAIAPKAGARMMQVIYESLAPSSIREPGIFFVAHVVYFGPVIVLAALLWGRISRLIGDYGTGISVCVLLGLGQGLESESRHLISIFAFVVPFAVKVMDGFAWRAKHYWLYGIASLVCSKIWLAINTATVEPDALQWPDQRFLMNFGHAMSKQMYFVQGLLVLIIAAAFAIVMTDRFRSYRETNKPNRDIADGSETPSVAA